MPFAIAILQIGRNRAQPRPRKGIIPPEFLRILSISLSSARHSGRRATKEEAYANQTTPAP